MAKQMKAICLVDGETTWNTFSVMVSSEDTVGGLKILIKTEKTNDFRNLDADKLTLWRVSIPIIDGNEEIPIRFDDVADKDKKKLRPVTRLSKVFPDDLPEDMIHIIVKLPPPAQKKSTIATFTVTVKGSSSIIVQWVTDTTTATLDELRRQIYAKKQSLDDGLLSIVVENSDCSDFTYLKTDDDLRGYLKRTSDGGVRHISVRLERLLQPFSEIKAEFADRMYERESPAPIGSVPLTTSKHIQALDDLLPESHQLQSHLDIHFTSYLYLCMLSACSRGCGLA
ncbi:hypothetical protein BGX30_004059 [Mortierella sp. GBA39]|nr:hypothetical protein BGX30_004059 [Mortierella sp. GBA39]